MLSLLGRGTGGRCADRKISRLDALDIDQIHRRARVGVSDRKSNVITSDAADMTQICPEGGHDFAEHAPFRIGGFLLGKLDAGIFRFTAAGESDVDILQMKRLHRMVGDAVDEQADLARETIANRYAEPAVARALLAALRG